MASKSDYLNARIEPELKAEAEQVFAHLGMTSSQAITMFYRQVTLRHGLPFDVCLPNATTAAALAEVYAGGGKVYRGSGVDVIRAILDDDDGE